MSGIELRRRANVDQNGLTSLDSPEQRFAIDVLDVSGARADGLARHLKFGQLRLGELAKPNETRRDAVSSQPVGDEQAAAIPLDETGLAKNAQMLRGVGDRLTDRLREALDRRRCLGKHVENGNADRSGKSLADACDLIVEKCRSSHVDIQAFY
jgi:hypothetical protein